MNVDDIKRLIDLVAGTRVTVLELTIGDAKLRIEAAAEGSAPASGAAAAPHPVPAPAAAPSAAAASVGASVRAPTDGLVHLRPSPDAEPFVVEGQSVGPDDTVCLIEVMKMFHPVPAGQAGTVRAVKVRDGQHVDFDEVILELA